MFFDRVAGEATANGTQYSHRAATYAAAKLVAYQTAGHCAAYGTDAGAMTFLTHFRDRYDRAAASAIGRLRCRLLRVLPLRRLRRLCLWLLSVLLLRRRRHRNWRRRGGLHLSLCLCRLLLLRLLIDRKSTRLNSSHYSRSRMPSSA